MKRRNFLGFGVALSVSALAPNLFAKPSMALWGAPALPSVTMAIATLNGKAAKSTNISFQTWRTPDQLRAGIANGSLKATMAPSNVAANLYNQGLNFKMFNILTKGLNVVLTKDENIKNYSDLIGKKLIIPFKNDLPDIVVRATLKAQGIDESKIDITYTQTPPEALGLFLTKDYDAAVLLEPLISACELRGKKMGVKVVRAIKMGQEFTKAYGLAPVIPQAGMIIEANFYKENMEFFELYQNDLQDAINFIDENPQSAAEIGLNYLPAPIPALANSFKNANLCAVRASEMRDDIMKFFEIVYRFNPKLVGGKIPDDGIFL